MVSNSLTFALGPRLLEEEPDSDGGNDDEEGNEDEDAEEENDEGNGDIIDEETTLLPRHQVRQANKAGLEAYWKGRKH